MNYDLGNWRPLSPIEANDIMRGIGVPWWVAGGWAVDLFVGRQTRAHGDMDILVLRRDQIAVQRHLGEWECHAAEAPGGLRPWRTDEFLPRGIHDIWCRRGPAEPWAFQLMLAEDDGEEWFFRRDPGIRGKISALGARSQEGIPFLAPEVQLLYKARPEPQAKDEADLQVVLPRLTEEARAWLLSALGEMYPNGHPWMAKLVQR